MQRDNANVPQPRMEEGTWRKVGSTFQQEPDHACLAENTFRRSMADAMRTSHLNSTLSIPVDVPEVQDEGVDP